jgi:hypothetical protein
MTGEIGSESTDSHLLGELIEAGARLGEAVEHDPGRSLAVFVDVAGYVHQTQTSGLAK